MQGEGREVAGSQPMSTAVHRSPNKLRRTDSIFILCWEVSEILSCRLATEKAEVRIPKRYEYCICKSTSTLLLVMAGHLLFVYKGKMHESGDRMFYFSSQNGKAVSEYLRK